MMSGPDGAAAELEPEQSHWLLGGTLSPIGWSVGFIDRPVAAVLDELTRWRGDLGQAISIQEAGPYPQALHTLDPLATPWTRELLIAHGDDWTAYLNNDRGGGDIFPVSQVARALEGRLVIVTHQPRTPVGHASSQFELLGPEGEPPLMYMRTLAAHAEDGRWSWETSGKPQPFERQAAYRARLIRDRLTRPLLVSYLRGLGVTVDNDARFGRSLTVTRPGWPQGVVEPLVAARARWGLTN